MIKQWMDDLSHMNPWVVAAVYKSAFGLLCLILIGVLWILCAVLAGWWGTVLGWLPGVLIQLVMQYIITKEFYR